MTPAFRIFLAAVLGVVAVAAGQQAVQYQTGAQWIAVMLIGTAFLVAVCAAGAAVVAAVWFSVKLALYERALAARIQAAAPPPSARHARPAPVPVRPPDVDPRTATRDARIVDYYGDDALTEARRAAAEAEQAPRDGATAPMPIVVVDAQPWPWTPPVAANSRRAA